MFVGIDGVHAKSYIEKEFRALIGKTIKTVRPCSQEIVNDFMWYGFGIEIVFTDDTSVLITQDEEGNGPGWMFYSEAY